MPLSAIIIDDEPDACKLLKEMLEKTESFKLKGVFCNPEEGLQQALQQAPDVLFLDVEMPGMSGIEVIQKLKPWLKNTEVVFVTAFPEYGLAAAQNNAFDYLLKPVDVEELQKLVYKLTGAFQQKQQQEKPVIPNDRLLVWSANGVDVVAFEEMVYLEADKNYTEIFLTTGKRILTSRSLRQIEKELPPAFFRALAENI